MDNENTNNSIEYFGASVRGPSNKSKKKLKEDAWLGVKRSWGYLIVTCDGMGSKENAREGAKEACHAVRDAVQLWQAYDAPIEFLFNTIHLFWEYRIFPLDPNDCATTCLFAYLNNENEITTAQLGDGVCVIRDKNGNIDLLDGDDSEFTNNTTGLGIAKSIEQWRYSSLKTFVPGSAVLLATDGVSEDVEKSRLGDMTYDIVSEYKGMSPRKRWETLCYELRNWATPHHLDDKTITLLWAEPYVMENKI